MTGIANKSLLDHFSALEDPRQACKVLYPLPEIMLVLLCATLATAEDFVEIKLRGESNLAFLRRFLPFKAGIPSHDTLNDVVDALDPELFKSCFASWIEGLRDDDPEIVAIDGKTSRRSHDKAKGVKPLHLVSAWASRQRLVLGQEAVDEKSNEITAIPLLLERLALKGALVTIDATGAQTAIVAAILAKGADYLVALKDNQSNLAGEARLYFDGASKAELDACVTVDGDHGRIETRRHMLSRDVAWLRADRAAPGEPRFPGLAAIGMVESTVEKGGETTVARRCYLTSATFDASAFARAIRAHRGIESRLHWILDVVFHDDLARLRSGNGPENMAIVKHMAVNLLKSDKPAASFKSRRKAAAWNPAYIEELVRGKA